MGKTICGHERFNLQWALSAWRDDPESSVACLEPSFNVSGHASKLLVALRAVNDPAKLAEMLAEEGQRLGLTELECSESKQATVCNRLYIVLGWRSWMFRSMVEGRAILMQWLQLPDGAREEAEHALRGDT